ncbi:hypothetical protein I79_001553 [Cricetulus griseus]|uniref:Uncharacterized protein n=1 Tax=Cricetulus griseus TaxID=10029 RepID=G3GV25_CRIGR|nr:hypothetical protein I79_001553 [Cricetulus griseus]
MLSDSTCEMQKLRNKVIKYYISIFLGETRSTNFRFRKIPEGFINQMGFINLVIFFSFMSDRVFF